ncbi:MAG: hypothetical protein HY000_39290 [Planctomycetes bacterium]|nr:hypothetical protein [Planctomycetota bacterium]
MASQRQQPDELDSPWKEALEQFLAYFPAFFFPQIHEAIEWQRGYESLDKELQQIVRDARLGRRLADKLFKVWRKDGSEAWLLIHVEVQGRRERDFAERMFVYSYRVYDRYRRPVVSLAVLCDDQPQWRPDHFEYNVWGCSVGIRFLVAKLLDYQEDVAALERSANPFAAVVLAQLKALETRQAPPQRWQWKVRLIKGLYERGLSAQQIRQLFRLIDWMLVLPEELEQSFREEIHRFEEERRMPYVTSVERLARQEGRQEGWQEGRQEGRQEGLIEGLHEGIAVALDAKLGAAGRKLLRKVRSVHDVVRLRTVARVLKTAKTVDDIRSLLS